MTDRPHACVVVPARDEEARVGACLRALATQRAVDPAKVLVVLVLDGCQDRTRERALAVAQSLPALRLQCVDGPARGPGPARALGLRVARQAVGADAGEALLASTDADTRVAGDWLTVQLAAVADGARAIGGLIDLDPREAAALPPGAVAAREARVPARLAAVRRWQPDAEHHQFSGASLALTAATYDLVGGLPAVAELEDEALERQLRAHGVPIRYLRAVRVTTSARLDGRCAGAGLAVALAASS
jgi:glucosyl-3-phosphoglycerate synthase